MSRLTNKNCGEVILILTRSWRYFAVASVLGFICQFSLFLSININQYYLLISTILFIASHYYIFRLWLDNHFFRMIYQQESTAYFDDGLHFLMPKKAVNRTMEQRWLGTKRIFNRGLLCVIILWGWLLISLITL